MTTPTDTTESNFILRRLGEPLPLDLVSSVWPLVLFAVVAAGLVALLLHADWRRVGFWAVPAGVLRGGGVAAAVTAFGFPNMVVGEWANAAWLLLTVGGVLFALGFVLAMYARDSRTARGWAVPLGLLRTGVYLLLAVAFLLPAVQYWELSEKRSRVVILLDVSPSVTQVSDEQATVAGRKPPTRLDKVLDAVLTAKLFDKLLEKNPVYVYRFGSRLDDEPQAFEAGASPWSKAELEVWANYDYKAYLLRGLSPVAVESLRASAAWKGDAAGTADWAVTWAKLPADETTPAGLPEADVALIAEARGKIEKRIDVARSIALGTNVPESVTAVLNREAGNLVQAVIVFSDGRSNLGSESAYTQLRERAAAEKVPVFTVAVGEARDTVGIQITEVQSPDRTPPDEAFKLTVEADGVGMAEQTVDVVVGLFGPGRDPKKDKPDFDLLPTPLKFAGDSTPPHGTAEFLIDPEKMPESLTQPSKKPGGKPQLKQGEWKAVARIAKDKRELFADAEHLSAPRTIQVLDKPTRILLFAGGPTREYQTLRTLLVRETMQNRAELSICLQTEGGRDGTGVQDVPAERLLTRFPSKLDLAAVGGKPEEKYANLNEYDLVIAFDPDWSELSPDQIKNLQTWVDNLGGGLIYVAGPLNTFQLARGDETGRLKPLLDILPVVPDDVILVKTRPIPRTPRRLLLKPNPEYDVLKLDEEPADDATAGWEPFFTGKPKFVAGTAPRENLNPTRGFFSYYPVKATKPGATTLGEFLDANDRGEPDLKPWIVTTQPARGRTVFLGSGETWRFRAFNQDFFDRFWVKMTRFAAGNRDANPARGRVLIGKEFTAGSQVRVQARLLAPNGQPYDFNATAPKFRVEQYNLANEKEKDHGPFEMRARKGGGDFDGYYAGQVLADPARMPPSDKRYRVVIDVPESAGDTIAADFTLKKSDPELDVTRPDFAALELAAGTLDEVRGAIKEPGVYDKLRGAERDPKRVKLAYRLADADKLDLIPACIDSREVTSRNRGPVRDLWDRPASFTLGEHTLDLLAFNLGSRRVEVGWLLLAVVALLGVEWTARKLLRMA